MPSSFPQEVFRAFGIAASKFFPAILSDEALNDPLERKRQFDWAWQAVRYRYRSCVECQDEFKGLLANPSESWQAGWGDEELTYKLERCIYLFFVSGLSIFDSFSFSMYFLGNAIQPDAFPDVANPRNITRNATSRAFGATFPRSEMTRLLTELWKDKRFQLIDRVRNLVGHRISGRRSVRGASTANKDGTHTVDWHEETWHLPGATGILRFDENMLQHVLNDITGILTALVSAARSFAEENVN